MPRQARQGIRPPDRGAAAVRSRCIAELSFFFLSSKRRLPGFTFFPYTPTTSGKSSARRLRGWLPAPPVTWWWRRSGTAMGQVERGANRIYGVERDRPTLRKYAVGILLACSAGLA